MTSPFEKTASLNDAAFKQLIGVKRATFAEMVRLLAQNYEKTHLKGGRPRKLSLEDQLIMTLRYLRHYDIQLKLAFDFEVGEATVHDTLVWVEDCLFESGRFSLPDTEQFLKEEAVTDIAIDVTESPIERPKKDKKPPIQEKRSVTP